VVADRYDGRLDVQFAERGAQRLFGGGALKNTDPLAGKILEPTDRLSRAENDTGAVEVGRQRKVDDFPPGHGDRTWIAKDVHASIANSFEALDSRHSDKLRIDVRAEGPRDLEAKVHEIACRLALLGLIRIGLGIGAVPHPEGAGVADAFEGTGGGGLRGQGQDRGQNEKSSHFRPRLAVRSASLKSIRKACNGTATHQSAGNGAGRLP